ncbi:MAG TPA: PQQ-binding-like beta-propeller repeat protein [Candidatus Acidoferrales bacterium]|nr:PQQ-binding-like beta-propeller repeat protein [Candidatus Acidoferrales bacterium]
MDTRVMLRWLAIYAIALAAMGCGSATFSGVPMITTQPTAQTAAVGKTATFTVTATGDATLMYQWYANGAPITGATSASYTTVPVTIGENQTPFFVYVSNSVGSTESATVELTVTQTTGAVTLRNDIERTGQNLRESILTPANVNSASFGKLGALPVDGRVDAQPLFLSGVTLSSAAHDVLYVATEHGSVYAFNAASGATLWRRSLLAADETPAMSAGCDTATGEAAITSTPSIDLSRGPHGALYVLAASRDAGGNVIQRLHALDVATGAELLGGPAKIGASAVVTRSGNTAPFDPGVDEGAGGLLVLNGRVYASWSANCAASSGNIWILAFDEGSLAVTGSLNVAEASRTIASGAGGSGLAADAAGNLYFFDANAALATPGTIAAASLSGAGNGVLRLYSAPMLAVAGASNFFATLRGSAAGTQTGFGGAMLLPDLADASGATLHLAVSTGKNGSIYLVNRDALGATPYQEINGELSSQGVYTMPAYFNQTAYFGAAGDAIRAFAIRGARLSTSPVSATSTIFGGAGTTPSISATGNQGGILWAVESGDTAVLHAYDATNLSRELYNSGKEARGRDALGSGNFIAPLIANGKVYVAGDGGVTIFGLLK